MEKPSLEIGNSNWAIKEGELLGYNRAGNDYLPIPITMTRASLGTRVNPEGLVEDVELLGSENIDLNSFYPVPNWDIDGSEIKASGTTALFKQPFTLGAGKTFKITIVVDSITSGDFEFWVGGYSNDTPTISVAGTYTYYVTSGGSELYMGFNPHSNLIATISSVSVKEATIDNLARVDYTDGTSSLLVEPMRRNLIPYSEDFSQSAWQKSNITATPNSITSPDGTLNAYKLTKPTSSPPRLFELSVYPSTGVHTFTSFYKNLDGDSVLIRLDGGGNTANCNVDLTTNTLVNSGANIISSNITQLSDGWIRVSVTANILSTSWVLDAVNLFDLSVGSSVYIYGAQLEEASYATSYIPTSGGTVTRVKDQYEKTGISNLINSEEGVLFVEMAALANSGNFRYISLFGSATDYVQIYYKDDANKVTALVISGGGISFNFTHTLTDATIFNKFAIKYKENDFALWVNGDKVGTDTSGSTPSSLSELALDFNGGNNFYGKVKQLQVYKTALTDDELTILTGTPGVHFYTSYAAMASGLTYKIE